MNELLPGLSRLTPMAWLSTGLAVLAVLGLLRAPADRLRHATPAPTGRTDTMTDAAGSRRPRGPAWFTGRPDGPKLPRRLTLGAMAGVGLCLASSRVAPGLGLWVWLAWPVIAVLGAVLLGMLEPRAVRRRREQLVADTPSALDLMAAGLAAGMPVRLAVRAMAQAVEGPIGEDLGRVLALADLGVAESEAWRSLAGHPQLGPAAQDLARSVESGTLMVEALGRHATTAREARRAAVVVRARSVGVRSVLPLMMCFIPAFLLLGVVPTVVSSLVAALG